MAALPSLITVAQLRQLPERGDVVYELHHGEVVAVTRPKVWHWELQRHLTLLLQSKLKSFGVVWSEMPYRPVAEFEFRTADVAALSHERWIAMDRGADLYGAPELVIEVKSPSNTRAQLRNLAALCLGNGTIEFWIVDNDSRSVAVIQRDGSTAVYGMEGQIPLAAFGSDSLPVAEIFPQP